MENETAPHAGEAASMLAAALSELMREENLTQREVASRLNYKSSVMLSHMALGRVPIPVEKVHDLTRTLNLDPPTFTRAVLRQRFPTVDWHATFPTADAALDSFAHDLAVIAGKELHRLPADKKRVLREVARDANPVARWVTLDEVPVLDLIRSQLGSKLSTGLSAGQLTALTAAIAELGDD